MENEPKDGRDLWRERVAPAVLVVLAVAAGAGAVWRFFALDATRALDETTLLYLGVAGALLLLRDVKSLSFGSYRLEFERRVAQKIDGLAQRVEDTQAAALAARPSGGARHLRLASASDLASAPSKDPRRAGGAPEPGPREDDPWKEQFGGKPVNGTRELEADVKSLGSGGFYRVRLRVRSREPERDPLRGTVQFFLHDSFEHDRPVVTVGPRGVAELALDAWGAFTVGALADDGRTKLELDLAELESAPREFREA